MKPLSCLYGGNETPPKCPAKREWVHKLWEMPAMSYHTVLNMNETKRGKTSTLRTYSKLQKHTHSEVCKVQERVKFSYFIWGTSLLHRAVKTCVAATSTETRTATLSGGGRGMELDRLTGASSESVMSYLSSWWFTVSVSIVFSTLQTLPKLKTRTIQKYADSHMIS